MKAAEALRAWGVRSTIVVSGARASAKAARDGRPPGTKRRACSDASHPNGEGR